MEENKTVMTGLYHIKVRQGDWEVEVAAPESDFVLNESNRLIDLLSTNVQFLNVQVDSVNRELIPSTSEQEQSRNIKPQTITEFFRQFKLQTHLEKMLVLGYWCEVKQQQSSFTQEDIRAKYKEVKEPAPKNLGRDLGSLVAKGFLLSNGKSADGILYELTNTGIKEVEMKLPQVSD